LIALTDGPKAMSEALQAVYPCTPAKPAPAAELPGICQWNERKALARQLRPIYTVPVIAAWCRALAQVIPFFAFPPNIRRVIYTPMRWKASTSSGKIIKTRGRFPSDDAATKLIWLALRNLMRRWTMPLRPSHEAMIRFAVFYPEGFTGKGA
jgi:putative transposase